MKLSDIFQLAQLEPKIKDKKMSIKTTYKFTRLFKEIEEQVNFFNETLSNLIKEYGKKDENGEFVLTENKSGVMIQEDRYNECMAKVQELNELEPELSYIPSFKLEELDNLELSIDDLNLLMPFIEEE